MRDKGGINLARYVYTLTYAKDKAVLEIGFGSGFGAYYLSQHGVKSVFAIDPDGRAVDFARRNFRAKNLHFQKAKIEDLKISRKFDVAVSFEVIEHLEKPEIMLVKVKKLLKRSGIFLVSTPNRALSSYDGDKPTNPYHVREYFGDEFYKLLRRYIKYASVYGIFLKADKKEKESSIQKSWRWQLASRLTKKRWIRRVMNYLPEGPKRLFTGESELNLSPDDFFISYKNSEKAPYFISLCKK